MKAIRTVATLSLAALFLMAAALAARPDWAEQVAWAGRFHPVVLHFPIGLLFALALLELFGRRDEAMDNARFWLWHVTAASAVVAAGAGWILSLEGGYDPLLLERHRLLGSVLASMTVIGAFLQRFRSGLPRFLYLLNLFLALVVLPLTGHLGGSLTHGPDYLTELLPWNSRPLPQDPGLPSAEANIHAILSRSCFECHGPAKQKGGLRLDTREGQQAVNADGMSAVVPGYPEESELMHRILLPPDHDLAMPPKGVALDPAEVKLLSDWIADGAVWKNAGTSDVAAPAPAPLPTTTPDPAPEPIEEVLARIDFYSDFHPLVERYCGECHNPRQGRGDLDLLALSTPQQWMQDEKLLEKSLWALEEREMPTAKAALPLPDAERALMVAWLQQTIDEAAHQRPNDPGPVVMARWTKDAYMNVIRDLTGVEIDVSQILPTDAGAGEGFGNVGQAQSMGVAQIERYLRAARRVLDHLHASPVNGFQWMETPEAQAAVPAEWRKQLVARWIRWHNSEMINQTDGDRPRLEKATGMTHGAYWEAAWRYEHRRALGRADATFADIAQSYDIPLYPGILESWYKVLKRDYTDLYPAGGLIVDLTRQWRALPKPGSTDARQLRARIQKLDGWFDARSGKLDYKNGSVERFKGGSANNRIRSLISQGIWWFPIEIYGHNIGKTLHFVATDADGRGAETAVIWEEGWVHFKDGSKKPWEAVWPGQALPLRIKAGSSFSVTVPAGVSMIEIQARIPNGMAQVYAAYDAPDADALRFRPGRPLLGADRKRVQEAEGYYERQGKVFSSRPGLPVWREADAFYDFDLFDTAYLGGPWGSPPYLPGGKSKGGVWGELPEDPKEWLEQPYFPTPAQLRRDAQGESRAEIDRLLRDLVAAANIPAQELQALRAAQGAKEAVEGVLPSRDEVESWPRDVQQTAQELLSRLRADLERDRAAAERDILTFTRAAWRMEPTADEAAMLLEHYDADRAAGETYDAAVKRALSVTLVSPRFLYSLPDPPQAGTLVELSGHALAERLAGFLWASIPDAALLDAAETKAIRSQGKLRAEVDRMLADDRSRALADDFAAQWLGLKDFRNHTTPDAERFKSYTPELRLAMEAEFSRFFHDLFRENRPVSDLIEADYIYVNRQLAQHYDLPGVSGDELRRMELPEEYRHQRGGVLGMGAMLTKTSTALRSSPVLRGHWIIDHLLGIELPPPPPNVPMLSDDETNAAGLTIDEQLARHRADPACASCHDRMDPPGIALERFDPIGRYRSAFLDGTPVMDRSELKDGTVIEGLDGLRGYLRENEDAFLETFCRKLAGYALGRGILLSDRALIDRMIAELKADELRPRTAIYALVESEQFIRRRGGNDEIAAVR